MACWGARRVAAGAQFTSQLLPSRTTMQPSRSAHQTRLPLTSAAARTSARRFLRGGRPDTSPASTLRRRALLERGGFRPPAPSLPAVAASAETRRASGRGGLRNRAAPTTALEPLRLGGAASPGPWAPGCAGEPAAGLPVSATTSANATGAPGARWAAGGSGARGSAWALGGAKAPSAPAPPSRPASEPSPSAEELATASTIDETHDAHGDATLGLLGDSSARAAPSAAPAGTAGSSPASSPGGAVERPSPALSAARSSFDDASAGRRGSSSGPSPNSSSSSSPHWTTSGGVADGPRSAHPLFAVSPPQPTAPSPRVPSSASSSGALSSCLSWGSAARTVRR